MCTFIREFSSESRVWRADKNTENERKVKKNVKKQVRYRQKSQVESQSHTEEQNIARKGRKIGDSSPGPSQQCSGPTPWRGGRGRGFSPEDRG